MRSWPEGIDEGVVGEVVGAGWGVRVGGVRYVPEGGGAHHWAVHSEDGRRWFVTCDDLDTKPWLGADRDEVFEGLVGAYGTALELRAAGLSFVAAPIAALSGAPAERLDERYSVAVFEHVAGEPGRWGRSFTPRRRRELVTTLARLHQATPEVRGLRRRGLEVPGRQALEQALDDLGHRWDGGPLSEPARRALAGGRDDLVRWLADLDRCAARRGGTSDAGAVVTHGEPHPGNVIRGRSGLVLVDWDTVALARPERDMWMIADIDVDETLLATYRDLTGRTLDRDVLAAHRLLWALTDLAAFTAQLRGTHRRGPDADRALAALRSILDGREPAPFRPALARRTGNDRIAFDR